MITYMDQMEAAAREAGIDLVRACAEEGIAKTTLMRWRKGEAFPRQGTCEAVLARIALIANQNSASSDPVPPTADEAA